MSLRTADLWHVLMLEGLNADCVPSPARQAWIPATYPPNEMGRPGIIVSNDGRSQPKEAIHLKGVPRDFQTATGANAAAGCMEMVDGAKDETVSGSETAFEGDEDYPSIDYAAIDYREESAF